MTKESLDLDALDAQLRHEPSSQELLEQFLSLTCAAELLAEPRRIEHLAECPEVPCSAV